MLMLLRRKFEGHFLYKLNFTEVYMQVNLDKVEVGVIVEALKEYKHVIKDSAKEISGEPERHKYWYHTADLIIKFETLFSKLNKS